MIAILKSLSPHVLTHIHTHTQTQAQMHAHINAHIHTHLHAHMHIFTHILTNCKQTQEYLCKKRKKVVRHHIIVFCLCKLEIYFHLNGKLNKNKK